MGGGPRTGGGTARGSQPLRTLPSASFPALGGALRARGAQHRTHTVQSQWLVRRRPFRHFYTLQLPSASHSSLLILRTHELLAQHLLCLCCLAEYEHPAAAAAAPLAWLGSRMAGVQRRAVVLQHGAGMAMLCCQTSGSSERRSERWAQQGSPFLAIWHAEFSLHPLASGGAGARILRGQGPHSAVCGVVHVQLALFWWRHPGPIGAGIAGARAWCVRSSCAACVAEHLSAHTCCAGCARSPTSPVCWWRTLTARESAFPS